LLNDPGALQRLWPAIDHAILEPVYETIARVRQDLQLAVAFLGFCGAPWTLATYMIAGQGTPDQSPARLFEKAPTKLVRCVPCGPPIHLPNKSAIVRALDPTPTRREFKRLFELIPLLISRSF
jgi:hypothetical protein